MYIPNAKAVEQTLGWLVDFKAPRGLIVGIGEAR